MQIKNHYGLASYVLKNDSVETYITAVGGHITADFNLNGKKVNPYFIAPWWNEGYEELYGEPSYPLRGVFFCFPFADNKPFGGKERPFHGHPAVSEWQYVGTSEKDGETSITLTMDIPEDDCKVEKTVKIVDGHNVIYMTDTVDGAVGKYPVGYHPTLTMPTELGNASVKVSDGYELWTSPTHIEDFSKGGYSCLPLNYQITDETNVPTVYGVNVDLTKQPFIRGFDDIYAYFHKCNDDFVFATLAIPSEGYLYFQLKDPKVFPSSMVWTEYCGRHYAPWNSRVDGCIEISAACQYFFYGITSAHEPNHLQERGFKTYTEFNGGKQDFKLINGVVEIPADYPGVKNITRKDANTICIEAVDGSVIETACCVDFLK